MDRSLVTYVSSIGTFTCFISSSLFTLSRKTENNFFCGPCFSSVNGFKKHYSAITHNLKPVLNWTPYSSLKSYRTIWNMVENLQVAILLSDEYPVVLSALHFIYFTRCANSYSQIIYKENIHYIIVSRRWACPINRHEDWQVSAFSIFENIFGCL